MTRHKRKAKRLQTCPQCGIGGFVNLKHHRCKSRGRRSEAGGQTQALELVKADAAQLQEIEEELNPVALRIRAKTEDLLYDLVEAGLYLMKAREVYRVCNVAHAGNGKFDGSAADTGFQGWLEEKYPDISRRSAYNYINGAANCGLTIHSNSTAVDKLREARALAGKTAGDIYRLKDQEQEQEQELTGGSRWQLMRDTAVSLREQCEAAVALKGQMNKKVYQTMCARLHRTLEELTDSPWDIVEKKQHANFKEHGDVYEIGS